MAGPLGAIEPRERVPGTAPTAPTRSYRDAGLVLLLLAGFAAAVVLRCAIGGAGVARSRPAGVVFAAALLLLAWVGTRSRGGARIGSRRLGIAALVGIGGAVVLCVPALASRLDSGLATTHPRPGFLGWAVVVTVVASAEEAFFRGTLYRLLEPYGVAVAIGVPAVAFAALHVPLYGWGAAPLDLAVGIWLGALRFVSGTVVAPAVTHVVADWAAWSLLVQG